MNDILYLAGRSFSSAFDAIIWLNDNIHPLLNLLALGSSWMIKQLALSSGWTISLMLSTSWMMTLNFPKNIAPSSFAV
jgi:hypothetical protein